MPSRPLPIFSSTEMEPSEKHIMIPNSCSTTVSRMSKISEEKENTKDTPTFPSEGHRTAKTYRSRFNQPRILNQTEMFLEPTCHSMTERPTRIDANFSRAVRPFQQSTTFVVNTSSNGSGSSSRRSAMVASLDIIEEGLSPLERSSAELLARKAKN